MPDAEARALESYFPRGGTSTAWDDLHKNYSDAAALAAIGGIIGGRYAEAADYSRSIVKAFYDPADLPPENAPPYRTALTQSDRERCLIALLVSQGETLTLALHIYLALMLEVSPAEIGHIIFLTGVYSGASRYADAGPWRRGFALSIPTPHGKRCARQGRISFPAWACCAIARS